VADAALIESIRIRAGHAPLWRHHAARLAASARALGLPDPPLEAPAGLPDGALRLTYDGRRVVRDRRPVGSSEPVRLIIATTLHEPYPHKTTDRAAFDRALEEARTAGADDALMATSDGSLAEAAIWGVYWWEGGTLAAPAESLGILPSVARRRIVEIAGPIAERRAPPEALRTGSPFVANAVRGVVAVASVDGIRVGFDASAAARTAALATAFWP